MWQSFLAIFRKEFLHIRRDRGDAASWPSCMPLIQLILFGFIDQTVHDVPTVVVDQDRSIDSPRADRSAARHQDLRDHAGHRQTRSDARADIIAGRARVGVVIPPDYHDKRARGDRRQDPGAHRRLGLDVSAQALARSTALVAP